MRAFQRLKRRHEQACSIGNNSKGNNNTRPARTWKPDDLRAVTLVADDSCDLSLGLVWTAGRQGAVILQKITGIAKHCAELQTGLHLVALNNVVHNDATAARQAIEDCTASGDPVTLLLGLPATSTEAPSSRGLTISVPKKTSATTANTAQPASAYVTARVYKQRTDSKTGLVLQSKGRQGVQIARLTEASPPHLRVGMRLLAIEGNTWFVHHTEAVALIRSWPAGCYFTLLLQRAPGSSSSLGDDASVATTVPGSLAEDASNHACWEGSGSLTPASSGRRSPSPPPPPAATPVSPRFNNVTLSPEQAAGIVLTDEESTEAVYIHDAPADVSQLSAGMLVVHLNGTQLASAGHYEHALQTCEEDVTLCVRLVQQEQDENDKNNQDSSSSAPLNGKLVTATAVRPDSNSKTGLVLANDNQDRVIISRLTDDSIFGDSALTAGLQLLSINNQSWFTHYQEAIGIVRSLTGEITIVAQEVPVQEDDEPQDQVDSVPQEKDEDAGK